MQRGTCTSATLTCPVTCLLAASQALSCISLGSTGIETFQARAAVTVRDILQSLLGPAGHKACVKGGRDEYCSCFKVCIGEKDLPLRGMH